MRREQQSGVWRRLMISAAISVTASELLAIGLMYLFIGRDFGAAINGWTVVKIGLTCAFVIPAILSPLMGYFPARLLKRVEAERRELLRASLTDPLTGLLNRRGFDLAASEALALAARDGAEVTALLIDIDHFKSVNDIHGHGFGDVALAHVAECLRRYADESGAIAARFGGEEFVALQCGATPKANAAAAEELRRAVATRSIALGRARAFVTVSIGLVAAKDEATLVDLLQRADAALYAAKRAGRNCVIVDIPSSGAILESRSQASAA